MLVSTATDTNRFSLTLIVQTSKRLTPWYHSSTIAFAGRFRTINENGFDKTDRKSVV